MRTVNWKSDGNLEAHQGSRRASKLRHVIYSIEFFLREHFVCQRKNGRQDDQLQGGTHQVPIVDEP